MDEYKFYLNLAQKLIEECDQEMSEIAKQYFNFWHRQKKFRSDRDRNLDGFLFCVTLIRRDLGLLEDSSQRSVLSNWQSMRQRSNTPTDYCPILKDIHRDLKELGVIRKLEDPTKAIKGKNEAVLSQSLDQQFEFLLSTAFALMRSKSNAKYCFQVSRWLKNLVLMARNAPVGQKIRRNETLIFLNYILHEGKCDHMPRQWDFIWHLPQIVAGKRGKSTRLMDDLKVPDHGVFVFLSFNNFGTP